MVLGLLEWDLAHLPPQILKPLALWPERHCLFFLNFFLPFIESATSFFLYKREKLTLDTRLGFTPKKENQ
jgi:hypothetical protein